MVQSTEEIVKEFLELWQKQFAYMSRDGNTIEKTMDAFRQMQEGYINAFGGNNYAQPVAAADIFRNIGNGFIQLAKSHAEFERRLAKLESLAFGGGVGTSEEAPLGKSGRARKRTAKTGEQETGGLS